MRRPPRSFSHLGSGGNRLSGQIFDVKGNHNLTPMAIRRRGLEVTALLSRPRFSVPILSNYLNRQRYPKQTWKCQFVLATTFPYITVIIVILIRMKFLHKNP